MSATPRTAATAGTVRRDTTALQGIAPDRFCRVLIGASSSCEQRWSRAHHGPLRGALVHHTPTTPPTRQGTGPQPARAAVPGPCRPAPRVHVARRAADRATGGRRHEPGTHPGAVLAPRHADHAVARRVAGGQPRAARPAPCVRRRSRTRSWPTTSARCASPDALRALGPHTARRGPTFYDPPPART